MVNGFISKVRSRKMPKMSKTCSWPCNLNIIFADGFCSHFISCFFTSRLKARVLPRHNTVHCLFEVLKVAFNRHLYPKPILSCNDRHLFAAIGWRKAYPCVLHPQDLYDSLHLWVYYSVSLKHFCDVSSLHFKANNGSFLCVFFMAEYSTMTTIKKIPSY